MSSTTGLNRKETYMGVRFEVRAQAVSQADTFIGHYRLLPLTCLDDAEKSGLSLEGVDDRAHPSMQRSWSTVNEALAYATEAAHSAIELLIKGRTQGQGHQSVASLRRLASE